MLIQTWLQNANSWFTQTGRMARKRRQSVVLASEIQVLDSRIVPVARPLAPASFTAEAIASDEVELAWKDVKNEKGYRIYMNDGSGWGEVDSVTANSKAYNVTDLEAGTTYSFYIEAFNSAGAKKSRTVKVTTPEGEGPDAPEGLTAEAISGTEIDLAWEDTDNEEGYSIYQFDGRKWKLIDEIDADETFYTVGDLDPDTEYQFYVEAFNSSGSSESDEVSATTLADELVAPDGLQANASSDTEIELSWNDVDNEDGYAIYQHIGGKWRLIDEIDADETSYAVSDLLPDSAYRFYVEAYNFESEAASAPVSASTKTKTEPPTTQDGFTAQAESDSSVRLSWDHDDNAVGYDITISIGASIWHVASIGPDETSFVVGGVFQDLPIEYVFQLITHDSSGNVTTQTTRFGGGADIDLPELPDLGNPGGEPDDMNPEPPSNSPDNDPFFQSLDMSDFM